MNETLVGELLELLIETRVQLDLNRLGAVDPRLKRVIEDAMQRAIELHERIADDADELESLRALHTQGDVEGDQAEFTGNDTGIAL
jgi:hypothetical protein